MNVLKKRAAIVEKADDEEGGGDSGEDGRFLPSEEDEPKTRRLEEAYLLNHAPSWNTRRMEKHKLAQV